MGEIIANGVLGLLMILLQDENPIFLVSLLRFCLGFVACCGAIWVAAWVIKDVRSWFWGDKDKLQRTKNT